MPSTTSYFPGGNPEVNGYSGPSPVDISLPAAASFFGTYFNVIHPQYPFLDIKSCTEYYVQWRERGANASLVGWPAFFVNMVWHLSCYPRVYVAPGSSVKACARYLRLVH